MPRYQTGFFICRCSCGFTLSGPAICASPNRGFYPRVRAKRARMFRIRFPDPCARARTLFYAPYQQSPYRNDCHSITLHKSANIQRYMRSLKYLYTCMQSQATTRTGILNASFQLMQVHYPSTTPCTACRSLDLMVAPAVI